MSRSLAFASLVLVGCHWGGGEDLSPPTPTLRDAGSTAPSGLSARDAQLLGSYELVFDFVAPPLPPVSIGNRARLDVREGPNGMITAALTPRWGERHAFTKVEVSPSRLLVRDFTLGKENATFNGADGATNRWIAFAFERDLVGSLSGTFSANDGHDREGRGLVRPDDLAPEITLDEPRKSRGGRYLPWDELRFNAAEPFSIRAWATAIQSSAPELHVPPTGRVDATTITCFPLSVDHTSRSLAITTLADPSGNRIVPFTRELSVHPVGTPRERHDFDDEAALASWGVERITDARCKKGGCILFPPVTQTSCTPQGIAGLLSNKDKKRHSVMASVRVLTSRADDILAPLTLSARATPDLPKVERKHTSFTLERTGAEPLPYESKWETITLDYTSLPVETVGFSFVRLGCDGEKTSIAGSDAEVAVIVDDVWLE